MTSLLGRLRRGIGARLLLAQALVLAASIGTAALVAAIVGPPLFHRHLLEAGHAENSPDLVHIEMAFQEASWVALGVAVAVAICCSLAVSWYLARRIQEPLTALATAAVDMAGGHYKVRLDETGVAAELDAVSRSFNTMAQQLEETEDTRRRLLADLGHEMRTPVSTIRACLESIEDGVQVWDAEMQQVLEDQVGRLTRLVTDISDVSAAEEGRIRLEPAEVDIGRLLGSSADAVRDAYHSHGVELVVRPPEPPCLLTVDPHRIGQVISNLLGNALRHSSAPGEVELSGSRDGDWVVVEVRDHGDGIPPGQLPHVFERFYRGDTARDRASRGSGIGLTISRAIVEAHGGTIEASSPGIGGGTTVRFTLPYR